MSQAASSRLLFNASEEVRGWAGAKMGLVFVEPCYAIGILNRKGELVGAAIYNGYEQRNVEATIVGKFGRHAAAACFSYAYDHLGCRRISTTVHERNERALKVVQGLGGKIEGRKRHFYDDGADAIILGILKEDCKVLSHAKPAEQSPVATADGARSLHCAADVPES